MPPVTLFLHSLSFPICEISFFSGDGETRCLSHPRLRPLAINESHASTVLSEAQDGLTLFNYSFYDS